MAGSALKQRKGGATGTPKGPATPQDKTARLGELGSFVGFNLRIAQEASFRTFARESGQPQLRPGRFAAMMVIRQNPGISPVELSRLIARDKSSVTPLIQDLERRGLVK